MQTSDSEVLQTAVAWLQQGSPVELVTLVKCWGSAPRPVGSLAAVRDDGAIVGSVSGGCIEKELSALLRDRQNTGLIQYSISHDEAMRFGLACGGSLDLVFERHTDSTQLAAIIEQLEARRRVARTVDIETGEIQLAPASAKQEFEFNGRQLVKLFGPAWRLILIGAGQLSRYVAEMALALDYEIIVCEPREHFSQTWALAEIPIDKRMPDEVVAALAADNRTAVLALSHEANLDDLAILEALESDVFYVGALGSKRSSDLRRKRLLSLGAEATQIARLHAPIGLAIGSRGPAEIAISILAELIGVRSDLAKHSNAQQLAE